MWVAAKRMSTGPRRYGALAGEEVETSLPQFGASSNSVEYQRNGSYRAVDGSGYPNARR